MGHPFAHPQSGAVLERVALLYRAKGIYASRDRRIIFVCGGPTSGRGATKTMRSRFIRYAQKNLKNYRIFVAEAAYKDYVNQPANDFFNVAEFEELIASVSDCIVLFPESPGSFAEAGFFAKSIEIRKKVLLVNDLQLQSTDSFVNIGPVDLFNTLSKFKPALQLNYSSRTPIGFRHIRQRIESRVPTRQREAFEIPAIL